MLVLFDTETTSLVSPRLIEMAVWCAGESTPLTYRFRPAEDITFEAMAAHHITPEMVSGSPLFKPDMDFLGGISAKEFFENNVIVAHNAEFDMEVMRNEGIEIKHWICTKKLAAELYDFDCYSLQYLRYKLWVNTPEMSVNVHPHQAASDVVVLKALFEKMKGDLLLN